MVIILGAIPLLLPKPVPWMVMLWLGRASFLVRLSVAGFTVILVAAVGPLALAPSAIYPDNALDGVAADGGRHHEGAGGRAIMTRWIR